MLFQYSYEIEKRKGFGFFKGDVKLMKPKEKVKIPHIGWNMLEFTGKCRLTDNLEKNSFVYFVHSYCGQEYNEEDLVASSDYYGLNIPGIVRRGNIIGVQFHPEKSGEEGIKLLKNFCKICK